MNKILFTEALNILENVVPKTYDPQEPYDVQDVLDVALSRVSFAKKILTEALASLDEPDPAVIKQSLTTEKDFCEWTRFPRVFLAYKTGCGRTVNLLTLKNPMCLCGKQIRIKE